MSQPPELSPSEFRARWPDHAAADVVLLDVREHEELAAARLADVLHIPMREVPIHLTSIPNDRPIVVMCHSGVRSRYVAEYLAGQGFECVFNLTGGIDAWSREVDPGVPRY